MPFSAQIILICMIACLSELDTTPVQNGGYSRTGRRPAIVTDRDLTERAARPAGYERLWSAVGDSATVTCT